MSSLTAKPVVDGLESLFASELRVVRLDVADPVGRDTYELLGLTGVPGVVVFDREGKEVYRAERRFIQAQPLRQALARSGVVPPGVDGE